VVKRGTVDAVFEATKAEQSAQGRARDTADQEFCICSGKSDYDTTQRPCMLLAAGKARRRFLAENIM
jgi:hypothetical protein